MYARPRKIGQPLGQEGEVEVISAYSLVTAFIGVIATTAFVLSVIAMCFLFPVGNRNCSKASDCSDLNSCFNYECVDFHCVKSLISGFTCGYDSDCNETAGEVCQGCLCTPRLIVGDVNATDCSTSLCTIDTFLDLAVFENITVESNLILNGAFSSDDEATISLVDVGTTIYDNADPTLLIAFNAAGTTDTRTTLTTSQTTNKIFTFPDITGTAIVDAGTQTIGGAKTFSAQVTATLGVVSPLTAGYTLSGTLTNTPGSTPQVLNTRSGTVTFTGVADIVADASGSVVITNSLVSSSTVGLVAMQTTTAAAGSTPRIETVTYGAGSITIVIRNSDPAEATGVATYQFSFTLFN